MDVVAVYFQFGAIAAVPSITVVRKVAKERREVMAGITTPPKSYLNADYRDGKSGAVIPLASTALGPLALTLGLDLTGWSTGPSRVLALRPITVSVVALYVRPPRQHHALSST